MSLLSATDYFSGQPLQFAQGNDQLNPQSVAALRGLTGQSSGIDMAALQAYFDKMAANQHAEQLLQQMSADPANYVDGGGAEAAPTLNPEALARYQAMTADPGSAPTVQIGGATYQIGQNADGSYRLESGDTGVEGQQMQIGMNADGTYGDVGAWNPGTTWTNGGRDMAIMAALAAAGGYAYGGAAGAGAGAEAGAGGAGWVSAEGGAGYAGGAAADASALGGAGAYSSGDLAGSMATGDVGGSTASLVPEGSTGWNSSIGLDGAAGDYGAASGVAAPAGYTGAAQTLAGTGGLTLADLVSGAKAVSATGLVGPLVGAALGAAGAKNPSTSTSTQQADPATTAYQQTLRQAATDAANTPFQAYTGNRVAPMTGAQMEAGKVYQQSVTDLPQTQAQISGLLGQGTDQKTSAANGLLGQTQDYFSKGTSALSAAANPYAQADNPYLQGTIAAANRGLTDSYNNLVAPKFSAGSSFGSSGLGFAEVLARENMAKQLADNANTLSYQGYNQAAQLAESGAARQDSMANAVAGRQMTAGQNLGTLGEQAAGRADTLSMNNAQRSLLGANTAMDAAKLPGQLASGLLGVGTLEQQTQQSANDAAYEEFMRGVNYPKERVATLAAGAGNQTGSTGTQSNSQSPYAGALAGAILGNQTQNWLGGNNSAGANDAAYQAWLKKQRDLVF